MFKEFNSIFKSNFIINLDEINFPLTSYVEQVLFEVELDNVPSIIVYPDGVELNTMLLPYLSLYSRYKNFFGDYNELTEELIIDEHIYYDGRLGKFKGKKIFKEWGKFTDRLSQESRSRQAIKIEFAHSAIEYIMENDFYKITRYEGDAIRLNNIGKRNSDNMISELIEQFKLVKTSVSTLINSSILYVKNKCDTDRIVNNTTINYGKTKNVKLSKLVPLSYWTSSNKEINYSGNKEGLASVVDITCNLENAINLIYDKEGIELVIIDLADFRGLDNNLLEQIIDLTDEKKLIMLLPFNKYKNFAEYFNESKFNQITITKSKAENYLKDLKKHIIQVNQQNLFHNYVNRDITFNAINENSEISFLMVYTEVKAFLLAANNEERTRDIFGKSFGILSALRSYMDFETSMSNENFDYIKDQLNDMESDIFEIIQDESFFSTEKLQLILEMHKKLVREVFSENRLAREVKNIIKYCSGKKILFVVQNNRVKSNLDSYIKGRFRNKIIHCKTITMIQNDSFYEVTYVLGVIPKQNLASKLFSLMVSSRIEFLYYESYLSYIKYLYKNNVFNLLEEEFTPESINNEQSSYDLEKKVDYNLISELTLQINEYNYKDAFRIYFGNSEDKGTLMCEYLINFNEFIGVFKRDYKVYRVNLEEQQLEDVKVSNLSIGDEILILNENFKSGAFIEEIVEALLQDTNFYSKYNNIIELSKIWKNVLLDYLNKNKLNISQLYRHMQNRGLKKTYPTFRSWILNDYIVGPDQESDYKLILSLDPELYSKWKNVYEACNKVRSLHIKLRHDVGKMIVESYFNDLAISENLSYLDIDFMNKVTICEVVEINIGKFQVANYMVNSVKKKEA